MAKKSNDNQSENKVRKSGIRKSGVRKVHALGPDSRKNVYPSDASETGFVYFDDKGAHDAQLGNREVPTSKEHRFCGPYYRKTTPVKGARVSTLYTRPISILEMEEGRIMAAVTGRVHISGNAPRTVGALLEYDVTHERIPQKPRVQTEQ